MKLNLLNERIVAYSKGGSILLRVNYSRALIRFLGASCPASIQPGKDCVNSLTLFPAPEKPTLVALAVWNREKMPDDWTHAYLLEIIRQGDAPWINLGQAWIPPSDRPGQALEWGVEVKIGKTTFSTCNRDRQSPSSRFVEDGNLLCRFLIGDAKPEEVTAAAEALQEEMALLEQRSELRRQLDETIKAEQAWPAKYAALQQQFAEANGKLGHLQDELGRAEINVLNLALQLRAETEAWPAEYAALEDKLAQANSQLVKLENEIAKSKLGQEASNRSAAERIAKLQGTITRMTNVAKAAHFGNRKKSLQTILWECHFPGSP